MRILTHLQACINLFAKVSIIEFILTTTFYVIALGIKNDDRGHSKSAFTQFAIQEREDPLWSHYTFGKDIDLGK